jgi:hypothetical protein
MASVSQLGYVGERKLVGQGDRGFVGFPSLLQLEHPRAQPVGRGSRRHLRVPHDGARHHGSRARSRGPAPWRADGDNHPELAQRATKTEPGIHGANRGPGSGVLRLEIEIVTPERPRLGGCCDHFTV